MEEYINYGTQSIRELVKIAFIWLQKEFGIFSKTNFNKKEK